MPFRFIKIQRGGYRGVQAGRSTPLRGSTTDGGTRHGLGIEYRVTGASAADPPSCGRRQPPYDATPP